MSGASEQANEGASGSVLYASIPESPGPPCADGPMRGAKTCGQKVKKRSKGQNKKVKGERGKGKLDLIICGKTDRWLILRKLDDIAKKMIPRRCGR